MPLPAACSRLYGYNIPTTRPSAARNGFVDLYCDDGTAIIFQSLDDVSFTPTTHHTPPVLTKWRLGEAYDY